MAFSVNNGVVINGDVVPKHYFSWMPNGHVPAYDNSPASVFEQAGIKQFSQQQPKPSGGTAK
jgi:hypothetical protein